MPVPNSINALSTTASNNPPAGTDAVFPELDNHLRTIYSFTAQLRDGKLDASMVSSFILTLLDDANAAAARTTLGSVGLTGSETIAGAKTFSAAPASSVAASAPNELLRKAEFDVGATDTQKGTVELATDAEAAAGTDSVRALVPSNLTAVLLGSSAQAWRVVTSSRSGSTDYTNSTGRPIQVMVATRTNGSAGSSVFFVSGTAISTATWASITSGNLPITYSVIVPNGAVYRLDLGGAAIDSWAELR